MVNPSLVSLSNCIALGYARCAEPWQWHEASSVETVNILLLVMPIVEVHAEATVFRVTHWFIY